MSSQRPTSEGRPATQELAELLLLRRRPAVAAVLLTVGLSLALAALAPGLVPANALTGLVVGVLALLVAFVAMLAADTADPVARGPRHLRVTGRTVLGRTPLEPTSADLEPVVEGLVSRLGSTRRIRLAIGGIDVDPRPVAEQLAVGVASAGHSVLLVDLTAPADRPGLTDVRAGRLRLGQAAHIEPGLQLARLGPGQGGEDVMAAAADLAAKPPTDLDLLVMVLSEDAPPSVGLAAATDRVVALVPLGQLDRDEVDMRLRRMEGSRSTTASVVVLDDPGQPVVTDERPPADEVSADEASADDVEMSSHGDAHAGEPVSVAIDLARRTDDDQVAASPLAAAIASVNGETAPDAAADAEPEPDPAEEGESATTAEPEPDPDPSFSAEDEPAVDPERAVEAAPSAETAPEPEPSAAAEPESSAAAEPEPPVAAAVEPDSVAEPELEPEPEPEAQPDPVTLPEAATPGRATVIIDDWQPPADERPDDGGIADEFEDELVIDDDQALMLTAALSMLDERED